MSRRKRKNLRRSAGPSFVTNAPPERPREGLAEPSLADIDHEWTRLLLAAS